MQRARVAAASAERDLAAYRERARESAERNRFTSDFYLDSREVKAQESGVAAARGRVAHAEGTLGRLQPTLDRARGRVDEARAALEAHRAVAHPEERDALAAAERAELAAVAAASQTRAAVVAAGDDVIAAEAAFAAGGVAWGMVTEARGHAEQARVRLLHAEAARKAACTTVTTATKALARARYAAVAAGADPVAYRQAVAGDLAAIVRLEAEAAVLWARIDREAERYEYARRRATELAPAAGAESEASRLQPLPTPARVPYLARRAVYLRRQGSKGLPTVDLSPLEHAATAIGDPRDVAELIESAARAARRFQ